eukprot:m.260026 g.260026  ORF g.260026 m.260026 type:complete len:310 (-) comp39056_c0_seq1:87-1016(-)
MASVDSNTDALMQRIANYERQQKELGDIVVKLGQQLTQGASELEGSTTVVGQFVRDVSPYSDSVATHHNEFTIPCLNRCCGGNTLVKTPPQPLTSTHVDIPHTNCKGEVVIDKLNPSSALIQGKTDAAKTFNRMLLTKDDEDFADSLVGTYTNSSIVMALLLTIAVPGDSPTPINDTMWGNDPHRLEQVVWANELVLSFVSMLCIFGLLFCVGLLSQIASIPKQAAKIFLIKMGPGKANFHQTLWKLSCYLYFVTIFLRMSMVIPAWGAYTWLAMSGVSWYAIYQLLVHGDFCVVETAHVLLNPKGYFK